MKTRAFFMGTIVVLILLICTSAFSQDEMEAVDTYPFYNPQRPAAVFRHEEHNETAGIEECNECHHVYDEDGRLIEDESSEDLLCSDCHEVESTGPAPDLMQAFHFNCKGCHQARKMGPVMCGQCHVRRPGDGG